MYERRPREERRKRAAQSRWESNHLRGYRRTADVGDVEHVITYRNSIQMFDVEEASIARAEKGDTRAVQPHSMHAALDFVGRVELDAISCEAGAVDDRLP